MPHRGRVMSITFSRDGTLLATASADGFARVFHARTGRLVAAFEFAQRVQSASFTPDNRRLLIGCDDGRATLWSLEPDPRPLADLRRQAELMAWNALDEFDSLIHADGDALTASWRDLVARYPEQFPKISSMPTSRPVH
jgi:WD40 repeat protein